CVADHVDGTVGADGDVGCRADVRQVHVVRGQAVGVEDDQHRVVAAVGLAGHVDGAGGPQGDPPAGVQVRVAGQQAVVPETRVESPVESKPGDAEVDRPGGLSAADDLATGGLVGHVEGEQAVVGIGAGVARGNVAD